MYDLSKAQSKARLYGYVVAQTNSSSVETPGNQLGWTDHKARKCHVFVDRIASLPSASRAKAARKVAMHEVGHARWERIRLVFDKTDSYDRWRYIRGGSLGTDQQVEEDYCETYSWCQDFQSGVSYSWRSPIPSSAKLATLCTHL